MAAWQHSAHHLRLLVGGATNCTELLEAYDKTYQNYKMMEESLISKQRRLRTQLKDIKSTLTILDHMATKKGDTEGVTTDFRLADAVWAKAHIPSTEKVSLWLGANVMLEYDVEEAQGLLSKNRDQVCWEGPALCTLHAAAWHRLVLS